MARERTNEELAEDFDRLSRQVQKLGNRFDNAPYVRHDIFAAEIKLHNAELGHVRDDLASVRTLLMWTLGILATMFASGVILAITIIARSAG